MEVWPESDNVWELLEDPSESHPLEESKIEISDVLAGMKLEKYEPRLVESGVRTLDDLSQVSEEKLTELKVPLGHKLKLMKKIK